MEETDALRKGLRERGIDYSIIDWGDREEHTLFYLDVGGVTCIANYYESDEGRFAPGGIHRLTIEPCGDYGHDKVLELIDRVMEKWATTHSE